ncbi:PP2C family serine/threonine-protein phosphatase [Maridesulfovibrio sp.]|uniref:PP2C family serine/threonine-protein phosphatase n=1 Tax=Maridesulfovibrio sp. TaxID=2795000 RepID=UPI002AA82352|nr:PP2C family serine/threonine-protein phosphatase [Maridesulfovibrio sp.]
MGNGFIFAIVADGAGSATFGAYGAWLTCRCLSVRFREWVRKKSELPPDEKLIDWINELRDQISAIALQRQTTSRQFATTLAAIFIAKNEVVTLHVGDSAIVGRKDKAWQVLCWPENGEYASSTYFVTDPFKPRLNIVRHPSGYDAFALFSDGVGDLALSYVKQTAHSQFFNPMFHPVDTSSGEGRLTELSDTLSAYLASPAVCERTDDDKTLILISKR